MIANEVIWLTGASSGIGEALARIYLEKQQPIVLSARREERLHALVAEYNAASFAKVLPLDLAETDRAPEKVAAAIALLGRIDVVIHNAGLGQRSLIADTNLDVDRRVMETNFFGPVAITKALLPHFRARKSGHVVVVSSVTGYVGTKYRSTYAASKHALHGFFESLRAEETEQGIDVTIVCPGYVDTDFSTHALAGDGSFFGKRGRNAEGISKEACAKRMYKAIEAREDEVFVGGREVAGIYLRRYAPGLLRKLLPRMSTI